MTGTALACDTPQAFRRCVPRKRRGVGHCGSAAPEPSKTPAQPDGIYLVEAASTSGSNGMSRMTCVLKHV